MSLKKLPFLTMLSVGVFAVSPKVLAEEVSLNGESGIENTSTTLTEEQDGVLAEYGQNVFVEEEVEEWIPVDESDTLPNEEESLEVEDEVVSVEDESLVAEEDSVVEEELLETVDESVLPSDLENSDLVREDDFLDNLADPVEEELPQSDAWHLSPRFTEVDDTSSLSGANPTVDSKEVLTVEKSFVSNKPVIESGSKVFDHQIVAGDTLFRLARRYNTTIDRLKALNNLTSDLIIVGQKLVLEDIQKKDEPTKQSGYQVVKGDTLYRIALKNGISLAELQKANNINDSVIRIGQRLVIPTNKRVESNSGKVENNLHTYVVQKGQTLYTVASKFGLTVYELKQANKLLGEEVLEGQRLIIPKREELTLPSKPSLSLADKVVKEAEKYLGTKYVWGGRQPGGFDCSGLMQWVYKQATGHQIGWWTGDQQYAGKAIKVSEAKKGDLYFWGNLGNTYHVGLALGDGRYIHAPQPGDVVKYSTVSKSFMPTFVVSMDKFLNR